MNELSINIDAVVREVLAELAARRAEGKEHRAEGGGRRAEAVEAKTNQGLGTSVPSAVATPTTNATSTLGDLAVKSRVVTMLELSGHLDSVRRLVVAKNAIVTPAVRDELLRRGITLTFDLANGCSAAPVRLVIMTTGTNFDPAALMAGLGREGLKVEHAALDCLIAAAGQLAAEVAKPDTLGALLTRHTAAGMCLANRLSGVRAITGTDAPSVAAAASAVGANVLVADPRIGTFFQLKQMVTDFARCGVRPCPEVFRAKLA